MLAARVQRNRRVSSTRASYRSRVRRAPRVRAAASPGLGRSHVVLYSPVFAYRPLPDATARPGPRPRRTQRQTRTRITVLVCRHRRTDPRRLGTRRPRDRARPRGAGGAAFRLCSFVRTAPSADGDATGHNASQVALQMRNVRRTTTLNLPRLAALSTDRHWLATTLLAADPRSQPSQPPDSRILTLSSLGAPVTSPLPPDTLTWQAGGSSHICPPFLAARILHPRPLPADHFSLCNRVVPGIWHDIARE